MNRFLQIMKLILVFLSAILLWNFYSRFGSISNTSFLIYTVVLILLILLSIKDIFYKEEINKNNHYNCLFIIAFLFIDFILIRTLFDTKFIYNSSYHLDILKEFYSQKVDYYDNYKNINIYYLNQNLWYFIIMLSSLLIYRKVNIVPRESKYSKITIVCLLLSIGSIIPTLNYLVDVFSLTNIPVMYLLFTLALLTTEIIELIRNNGKKREWPIYICFFFNLFAFISIFT